MSENFIIDTTEYTAYAPENAFKCSGHGLAELLHDKGEIVGLEIGCDAGDTAQFLLSSLPGLTLHSVDPYETYVDWNGTNLNNRVDVLQMADVKLSRFEDRYTLHKKSSDAAVDDFNDGQFDVIFIDGLHTYEQLSKDCENYYSKIKDGGLFSGHDFTAISGVNRAVKEFALKYQKTILTCDCDVWYWVK